MSSVFQQIDEVLKLADECELIGGLAVDKNKRRSNRKRAAELRQLAYEAQAMLAEQHRLAS